MPPFFHKQCAFISYQHCSDVIEHPTNRNIELSSKLYNTTIVRNNRRSLRAAVVATSYPKTQQNILEPKNVFAINKFVPSSNLGCCPLQELASNCAAHPVEALTLLFQLMFLLSVPQILPSRGLFNLPTINEPSSNTMACYRTAIVLPQEPQIQPARVRPS